MSVIAKNPIMPGFYPDPSLLAVDGDYYLINSTFAYFPGLPIMHSRDLVHWEQIGNAMHRQSQLPLPNAGHSAGLFAPTMRYYNGTYYVICTNVSFGGNYIVTADNPAGPWSEPHYLKGADGIDPSLFFDEDGRCYYIGTHPNPEGYSYNGDYYIWIQEVDIEKFELIGEVHNVWNGAMKKVPWPEGPHIYKRGEYYYIMHAEGGTGPEHAVSVCRSRNIFGPYENNYCNPILTHRHLGQKYPIKYVGHADLFETPNGEWYMVMLAVRPLEGYTTMGRETFLAKVIWENDWPVVNPGVGILTDEVEIDLPEWLPENDDTFDTSANCVPGSNRTYRFASMKKLGDEFMVLRNSEKEIVRLDEEGCKLAFRSVTLKDQDRPGYVCIRQQHHSFETEVVLATDNLTDGRRAGMAYVQSNTYHLRTEVSNIGSGKVNCQVILCQNGEDQIIGNADVSADGEISLLFTVTGLTCAMYAVADGRQTALAENIDVRNLSTEVAGGFVGCTVGMYAVAKEDYCGEATFRSLRYEA